MAVEVEERLENVEHLRHLCEDESTMGPGFHPPQQNIQRLQLSYIPSYWSLETVFLDYHFIFHYIKQHVTSLSTVLHLNHITHTK